MEYLHYLEGGKKVTVNVYGFNGAFKCNYIGGDPINRTEMKVRIKNVENIKATSKHEVTVEELVIE